MKTSPAKTRFIHSSSWNGSWNECLYWATVTGMERDGTGHIERLPSGSYRVHVYAGTDPLTGRAIRHRQTVKTPQQARIVLGRLLEQAADGRRPDSRVTVADVLARYMDVAELEPSTSETYAGYIRRTILPALGSMELRKVRGPVLDTFYARLRRCSNLACTSRPFTEHRAFPGVVIEPGRSRSTWRRAAAATGRLSPRVGRHRVSSCRRCASWPFSTACRSRRCGARSKSWLPRE